MKLNRHISILLAFLILGSNIGLAFNVHYCGNRVSSVSLAYKAEEPCNDHHKKAAHKHQHKGKACCASSDNHKKCCKNDLLKLEDKSSSKVIAKSLQLDLAALCAFAEWKPAQFDALAPVLAKETPSFYCESHAPPLFKLYCSYILYA